MHFHIMLLSKLKHLSQRKIWVISLSRGNFVIATKYTKTLTEGKLGSSWIMDGIVLGRACRDFITISVKL